MYVVVVKYGTVPNQVYAGGIRSWSDAQKLQEAAKERGFNDARIVNARDFYPPQEAPGGSSARAA